jgi:hypothetical protein
MILAAHLRLHALGDRSDDLVRNIEAIGLVDAAKLVDRRQQEAAGGAKLQGLLYGGAKNFQEARTVEASRARRGPRVREIGRLGVARKTGLILADHVCPFPVTAPRPRRSRGTLG